MILFTVSGAVLVILQYFFNFFTAFIILFTVVIGVDT